MGKKNDFGLNKKINKKTIPFIIFFFFVWLVSASIAVYTYVKDHKGVLISEDDFVETSLDGVIVDARRLESEHGSFYIFIADKQNSLYRKHLSSKYIDIISIGDSVYKEKGWNYMTIKAENKNINIKPIIE